LDNYVLLQEWSAHHIEGALFYLMAFLAIPLAYGVLFDPRIIRCGFLLIGVFGAISGIFFLLQAPFLALAQLMIYAVGITLVVVIALMLTNPRLEFDVSPFVVEHKLPAILVSIVVFATIYMGLRSETWQATQGAQVLDPENNILQLGIHLLTYYAIPFEFASVLLLIALVGAIMLAKADRPRASLSETWIDDAQEANEEHVATV
jgi:NAD(P)H-quinone oxidoreductase subunit 6